MHKKIKRDASCFSITKSGSVCHAELRSISTISLTIFQLILFLFLSTNLNAQWLHDFNFINHDRDSMPAVRFDFDYEVAADAISNEFIRTYANDKFIDVSLKDKVSGKLKSNNHLGSELNTGFGYRSKTFHKHWKSQVVLFQWTASLKQRLLFDASFSKDLFRLYFYGNKIYEGQEADFSNFHYSYQQFQQIQIGSVKTVIHPEATIRSFMAVSYLNGQDYLSVEINRGKLFTAKDAEYIDLDLALTSRQADSSNHKFGAVNGAGASFDGGFLVDLNKWKFALQLNDLGFITWNKKSTIVEVDTTYHFEGAEVQNVLDSIFIEIKSDQDFKNGFLKTHAFEKFTKSLPPQLLFSIETFALHPKIHAYGTARYRFGTGMIPHVLIGGDYLFNKAFYAGLNFQYGGYSKLHVGIRAGYDTGKGWMFYAGTSYLDGLLLKNNAGGAGGSLSLQKVF